jgi:hypothetical protein
MAFKIPLNEQYGLVEDYGVKILTRHELFK